MRSEVEALVIGAGAAGVAATRLLMAAGIDTLVLEARARAGGRAWTALQVDQGAPLALDMGCAWLHSADENPYVAIARRVGFTIDETLPPWQRAPSRGAVDAASMPAFMQAREGLEARVERAAQAIQSGHESDRAAATLLEPGAPWNALLDAVCTYVNGVELSGLSILDYARYRDTEINYRIVEGYGHFIDYLSEGLPIAFDCVARRVDHGGARVRVETDRGAVSADVVIIALPTSVMAQGGLRFAPDLPSVLEACAGLPLGVADKVFLRVEGAEDLPEGGALFGARDRVATGTYHLRPLGQPIIEGFFGGACARALEAEGLEGMGAFAIDELVALLGSQWRARLKPIASTAWAQDDFARGSYSHALPGHAQARAQLAQPVENRLFFCGEATSPHFFSTAHGAHESGERAAREAIAALRGSVAARLG